MCWYFFQHIALPCYRSKALVVCCKSLTCCLAFLSQQFKQDPKRLKSLKKHLHPGPCVQIWSVDKPRELPCSVLLVNSLAFGLIIPCGTALPDRLQPPLAGFFLLESSGVFRHVREADQTALQTHPSFFLSIPYLDEHLVTHRVVHGPAAWHHKCPFSGPPRIYPRNKNLHFNRSPGNSWAHARLLHSHFSHRLERRPVRFAG